jgi:hypothetical protein
MSFFTRQIKDIFPDETAADYTFGSSRRFDKDQGEISAGKIPGVKEFN